jgi:hypothetical protein
MPNTNSRRPSASSNLQNTDVLPLHSRKANIIYIIDSALALVEDEDEDDSSSE